MPFGSDRPSLSLHRVPPLREVSCFDARVLRVGLFRTSVLALAALQFGCGARSSLNSRGYRASDTTDDLVDLDEPSTPPSTIPVVKPPSVTPIATTNVTPPTNPTPNPLPTPVTPVAPDVPPTVPDPHYDGWASCRNPLRLDFAAGSGGTYTSFSDDAVDTVTSVCSAGKDVVFSWIAPSEGYFAFSTPNTEYDVSIALLAKTEDCSVSLACGVEKMAGAAYLEYYATLGEAFLIALESADTGRFSLTIEPLERPR